MPESSAREAWQSGKNKALILGHLTEGYDWQSDVSSPKLVKTLSSSLGASPKLDHNESVLEALRDLENSIEVLSDPQAEQAKRLSATTTKGGALRIIRQHLEEARSSLKSFVTTVNDFSMEQETDMYHLRSELNNVRSQLSSTKHKGTTQKPESSDSGFQQLITGWIGADEGDDDQLNDAHAGSWGLHFEDLKAFHDKYIEDMRGYCEAHQVDGETFRHVCRNTKCDWPHNDCQPIALFECSQEDLRPMQCNMHLVATRWVKFLTQREQLGYAIWHNTPPRSNKGLLKVTVFISHCWSEDFAEFVDTLVMFDMSPQEALFICSFALNQHALPKLCGPLEHIPFVQALKTANSVLVLFDQNLDPPKRLWCCFEVSLAWWERKSMFVWMHPKVNFEQLRSDLKDLDTSKAEASDENDKELIRRYIDEHIGFVSLTRTIRTCLDERVKVFEAACRQMRKEKCSNASRLTQLQLQLEQKRLKVETSAIIEFTIENFRITRLYSQKYTHRSGWTKARRNTEG
eukprot:TRINITY_DN16226_c0_g2_i2.p1 TRINITY_DN16226_c0_g2~~TRINITY_DN16226_c0_g2_i2.p1  ORF type:complete len:517 (+),score=83.13 TRINITY_DN16226_c0_g2_i2:145-1695(+)